MNLKNISLIIFVITSFTSQHVFSSESSFENKEEIESKTDAYILENEVDGLIIDRTMTRLGDDFYFFFSQYLNERHGSLKENLTVKERPTALSGSIISVLHRERVIYRTALSPGRKQAENKAKAAMNAVTSYLIRWKAQLSYQDTFDLERDEF
ncbi:MULTISPECIES: curli production assembly/transport protein CsgE [Vibrio]|uniref:curli production assembly/transport protein CsgE n=1 Tax=Vibrio TaxID=662 RepID=UPI00056F623D|nr:curli production assembly/transport protein CsgE [Vibrio pacinii]